MKEVKKKLNQKLIALINIIQLQEYPEIYAKVLENLKGSGTSADEQMDSPTDAQNDPVTTAKPTQ